MGQLWLPAPRHGPGQGGCRSYSSLRPPFRPDLASVLFSDALLPQPATLPARPLPPVGMGSKSSPCSSLQGFGFSSEKSSSTSTGEVLLSTIQRAAEAVANAVLPSQEGPRLRCRELHEDAYQPVSAPPPRRRAAESAKPPAAAAAHSIRVSHQPGLAAGGWEETDSGHSSQDSSQENGELSRTSDSYSKSGSDSHSGASRELVNVAERVDADSLGDCLREVSLVTALTRGARVFLTRDEVQHFVKECGLLNCEVVGAGLAPGRCGDPALASLQRSMCAISSLMCSDLLSLDQIFAMTQQHLQQLSQGSPGPVANRATKILRQFEALCRSHPSPKSSQLDTDPPSALAAGSVRCTQDLLADILPLTGESILQPVSPVATPARVGEQRVEAETCGQSGVAVPACPCEQEASSRLAGIPGDTAGAAVPSRSLSLFAGMELVARPGMVLSQDSPPAEPRTLSRPGDAGASSQTDAECNREPSAFSFLNM
nr:PREDICTED: LOW QUALITY PROTEIN: AP-4 complex accessory subunit tepsin [Struthio camelus australis]